MELLTAFKAGNVGISGFNTRLMDWRNRSGDPPVPATKQQIQNTVVGEHDRNYTTAALRAAVLFRIARTSSASLTTNDSN